MLIDFDHLIERVTTARGQSARSILRSFYKLIHRFEKAAEAIESAIDKLEAVDPAKAAVMRKAWGDENKIRELIQRMDQAVAILLGKELS